MGFLPLIFLRLARLPLILVLRAFAAAHNIREIAAQRQCLATHCLVAHVQIGGEVGALRFFFRWRPRLSANVFAGGSRFNAFGAISEIQTKWLGLRATVFLSTRLDTAFHAARVAAVEPGGAVFGRFVLLAVFEFTARIFYTSPALGFLFEGVLHFFALARVRGDPG